jgi:hypothetical protein
MATRLKGVAWGGDGGLGCAFIANMTCAEEATHCAGVRMSPQHSLGVGVVDMPELAAFVSAALWAFADKL